MGGAFDLADAVDVAIAVAFPTAVCSPNGGALDSPNGGALAFANGRSHAPAIHALALAAPNETPSSRADARAPAGAHRRPDSCADLHADDRASLRLR